MKMTEKEKYILIRRKKKIRLRHIAEHLHCSISLLSRWERDDCKMSASKVKGYREFIDNFNGGEKVTEFV